MSFGLDIETKDIDGNPVWVEIVDGQTYNLSPMWQKAIPSIDTTSDLEGRACQSLLHELDTGLHDAVVNASDYRKLEPDNGWGDYAGFFTTFAKFVELCHRHPSGVIRWNG